MIIQITRLHVSDYKDLCDKSTLQLRQSKGGKWLVSFDWSYPYCGMRASHVLKIPSSWCILLVWVAHGCLKQCSTQLHLVFVVFFVVFFSRFFVILFACFLCVLRLVFFIFVSSLQVSFSFFYVFFWGYFFYFSHALSCRWDMFSLLFNLLNQIITFHL